MKKIHKATLALAGALLLGTGLFTACPHNTDSGTDTPPSNTDSDDFEEEIIISGDIKSGEEKDAKDNVGTLIYWADNYWTGSKVTVSDASYSGGEYSLTFDQEGSSTFGLQLFLAEKLPQNKTYIVYGEFTSSADNKVTVNGSDVDLLAGEKQEVSAAVSGTGDVQTVLSVQYNIDGKAEGKTLRISNLKIFQIDAANLELKKLTLSLKYTEIAVGDTTDAVISGEYDYKDPSNKTYTFIRDASGSATLISSAADIASVSGSKITGISAGETSITGKIGDITSNAVKLNVTAEKDYGKYWKPDITTESQNAPVDYFSIWADQSWAGSKVTLSDMTATEDGVSLTQSVEGSNWYGTQIWYGVSAKSDFEFKVKSSVDGDITIADEVYSLEANVDKEVSVEGVEQKLAIQLGTKDPVTQLGSCTFTISDFSVTKAN